MISISDLFRFQTFLPHLTQEQPFSLQKYKNLVFQRSTDPRLTKIFKLREDPASQMHANLTSTTFMLKSIDYYTIGAMVGYLTWNC
jgi:hypothetical protein